ncbi:plasmid pRiA4b ORF-3 family protein [Psychrobacillus sp. L4]|uniref:plasmid pRiA4b ORF-3 family protein n=1 Tax=Psychrobacillus sp. L4 TaxID=3236892 RepID=UPI0036F3E885
MNNQSVDKEGKLIFTSGSPSSIAEDFKKYLNYMMTHEVKLTKVKGYITKKDLLAIDSQMVNDKSEDPKQMIQIGYPKIHLFYHLSITLDLLRINRSTSVAVAMIQNEQVAQFMQLTSVEQYVSLLEAFWTEADWNELQGEKWGRAPRNIDFLLEELEKVPANKVLELKRFESIEHFVRDYGQFFYYFSYFGLWTFENDDIKSNEPKRAKSTIAKTITLSPFFKEVLEALLETWDPYKVEDSNQGFGIFASLFNLPFEIEEEEEEEVIEEGAQNSESLFTLLKPLFPIGELTTTLRKAKNTFLEGTYLLKVKLNTSCWRTVQLSSFHTLLDLHKIIQRAFDFDDDHLYAFYMDNKEYSEHCYNAPMDFNGPYVNEIEIGNLNLYEGQSFLYLFDFGDEWKFDVQVLKITQGETMEEARIRKEHGASPDQYSW